MFIDSEPEDPEMALEPKKKKREKKEKKRREKKA